MLLFFLLPLFAWAETDGQKRSRSGVITAVLFAFLFSVPTLFGVLTGFRLSFGAYTLTYVELFVYAAAWVLLGVTVLADLRDASRRKKGLVV